LCAASSRSLSVPSRSSIHATICLTRSLMLHAFETTTVDGPDAAVTTLTL
jgi:hypothetical protein